MKISAVIIARKGSKRLKNKMYQNFFGNSLIENKIKQEVEDATEVSKSSPIPDTKEIFTDVWADGGYKWHN